MPIEIFVNLTAPIDLDEVPDVVVDQAPPSDEAPLPSFPSDSESCSSPRFHTAFDPANSTEKEESSDLESSDDGEKIALVPFV